MSSFLESLKMLEQKNIFSKAAATMLKKFYKSYMEAVQKNHHHPSHYEPLLLNLLKFAAKQLEQPFAFDLYHIGIRKPFDYYQFGLDFIRPLIDFKHSSIHGLASLDKMEAQLKKNENVIFLANHQIEPDPQVISLLLEKKYPKLAEEMISIAGHRVITDPLAVPFSKGLNLLCIYSKKYIEYPPEKKEEKLIHNQKTMKKMTHLLKDGGKCIYVAPSGGRDRPNAKGVVNIAKFDPQSIEMFYLMAKQSKQKTHFYPLALTTYALLPPPLRIRKEIGELRCAQAAPVHLAFGEEIDMENFPGSHHSDKRIRRKARADYIFELVQKDYQKTL